MSEHRARNAEHGSFAFTMALVGLVPLADLISFLASRVQHVCNMALSLDTTNIEMPAANPPQRQHSNAGGSRLEGPGRVRGYPAGALSQACSEFRIEAKWEPLLEPSWNRL